MKREVKSGGGLLRFKVGPCYGVRLEAFDKALFPLTVIVDDNETDLLTVEREESFYFDKPHTFTVVQRHANARWLVSYTEDPAERLGDSARPAPVRIARYELAAGATLATGTVYDILSGDQDVVPTEKSIYTQRFQRQYVYASCPAIGGTTPTVKLQFNYLAGAEDGAGEAGEATSAASGYRTVSSTLANAPTVGSQLYAIRVGDNSTSAHADDTVCATWSPYSAVTLDVAGGGADVTFTDGLVVEWWGVPW